MDIRKWNWETHEYEPYEVKDGVVIILFSQNLDLPINCASCFRDMVYGDSLTSMAIHNSMGLGYPVCDDCHDLEVTAKQKAGRSVK